MSKLRSVCRMLASVALACLAHAAEYSIASYTLRLEPAFQAHSLHEVAILDIRNPSGAREFSFLLNARYQITRATANGHLAEIVRDAESLDVRTPEPWPRLTLRFDIDARPGASGDERREVITANDLFLLWSDLFYPVDFERWSQVTTTIVLPAEFKAIAPGRGRGLCGPPTPSDGEVPPPERRAERRAWHD